MKCVGRKREGVPVEWRRHIEEIYYVFSHKILFESNDKIRKTEMGWACSCMGDEKDAYRALVGKPEENGQHGG
jgi:hypothetical protein